MGLYNIQLIILGLKVLVGRLAQTFVIPNGVEKGGVNLTSRANDMLAMLVCLKFLGRLGWKACSGRFGGGVKTADFEIPCPCALRLFAQQLMPVGMSYSG